MPVWHVRGADPLGARRSKGPAGAGMGAVGAPRARARPGTAPTRKWMEAYEVFDAEDGELMEELRQVAGLAGGAAERHRELVRQELQERGVSESLQQDIREELAGGAGVAGDAAGGGAAEGRRPSPRRPRMTPRFLRWKQRWRPSGRNATAWAAQLSKSPSKGRGTWRARPLPCASAR